jgi:D-alanyl-D-alanine carboxypeptidase
VLQLVDERIVTFDDTVAKWLNDPTVARIPNVDRITLRQLLNHSSGIYDYADDVDSPFWADAFLGPNADWTKVWTVDELLAYANGASHAPYFEPGNGVHNSNTDYILLGLVVEQATAHRFKHELQTRVLKPLALNDTFLAEGGEMPIGIVNGYQEIEGQLVDVSESNMSWIWTAGGMDSTTADLARFGREVFSGKLIPESSFKEMFTFVPEPDSPGNAQGMGIYRTQASNGELIGMDGSGPRFSSSMMRHPATDVTVITLANKSPDAGATDQIRDEAIHAVLQPA